MHAEDAELRDRLVGLKLRRDESSREITHLKSRMVTGEPLITSEKVGRRAIPLRGKLYDGTPELRQAWAGLLMNEAAVSEQEIRIGGSNAVLTRIALDRLDHAVPAVSLFCSGMARQSG